MFRYAQIDENGNCVSISQLSGEVESEFMKLLNDNDDVRVRDIWNGETWTRPEPLPPSTPSKSPEQLKIEELEANQALMQAAIDDLILNGGGF